MAHFESDAEVYDQLGGILTNLVSNTERLQALRQADAVVQFAFREPDAKVTMDVRASGTPRIDLGDTKLTPEVVLSMDADTGRALLSGELNPTVALARGEVRTKGPVAKVLRVVPVTVGAHEVEADAPLPEPEAEAEAPAATEEPQADAPAEETAAEEPPAGEAAAPEAAEASAEAEAPAEGEAPEAPAGEPEAPVTPPSGS